jgi:predicted RNase H-like nuclease (RuvC/YqgF family)
MNSDLKSQFESYSLSLAALRPAIEKVQTDIASLNKDLDKQNSRLSEYDKKIANSSFGSKDSEDLKKAKDKATADRDALQKRLDEKKATAAKLDETFRNNSVVAENAGKELATQNENSKMKAELAAVKVDQKIDKAQVGLLEADQKINEIEKRIEKGEMGIYMKDKVGQLINSNLLCHGVNRCVRGKDPMPVSPELLNEIFKNKEMPTRSEHYYQIRGQQTPQSTK